MTMKYAAVVAIKVATIAAWIVAGVDAAPWQPWGFEMDPDMSLFTVAAACVSSYAWISKAHQRPAVELFLAGKDIGRREAILEQQCENVKRMSEQQPPSLRVVSGAR